MVIEIKTTLNQEEREGKMISSSLIDNEIKEEIINILKDSNYKEISPIIEKEKNRFSFDKILTQYINATFNKDISIIERKSRIKTIIKWIFNLTQKDLVWQHSWKLRIVQFGVKNKKAENK